MSSLSYPMARAMAGKDGTELIGLKCLCASGMAPAEAMCALGIGLALTQTALVPKYSTMSTYPRPLHAPCSTPFMLYCLCLALQCIMTGCSSWKEGRGAGCRLCQGAQPLQLQHAQSSGRPQLCMQPPIPAQRLGGPGVHGHKGAAVGMWAVSAAQGLVNEPWGVMHGPLKPLTKVKHKLPCIRLLCAGWGAGGAQRGSGLLTLARAVSDLSAQPVPSGHLPPAGPASLLSSPRSHVHLSVAWGHPDPGPLQLAAAWYAWQQAGLSLRWEQRKHWQQQSRHKQLCRGWWRWWQKRQQEHQRQQEQLQWKQRPSPSAEGQGQGAGGSEEQ